MSEARGYVPIVTPQQVVLSSKNLPPVSADSAPSSSSSAAAAAAAMATSGVSNGPTEGVAEVPSKATPTKDTEKGKLHFVAEVNVHVQCIYFLSILQFFKIVNIQFFFLLRLTS